MRHKSAFKAALVLLAALTALGATACGGDRDGQVAVTWELQSEATGGPVACLPGDSVQVTVGSVVDIFDCSAGSGVTGSVPEGTQVVTIDLVDAGGAIVSTADVPVDVFEHEVSDAGHVVFLVP